MPRIERVDVGDYVYHVLNRANVRAQIFDTDADYQLFEQILEEGAVEEKWWLTPFITLTCFFAIGITHLNRPPFIVFAIDIAIYQHIIVLGKNRHMCVYITFRA